MKVIYEESLCREEGRRGTIHYLHWIKRVGVVLIVWAKGKREYKSGRRENMREEGKDGFSTY